MKFLRIYSLGFRLAAHETDDLLALSAFVELSELDRLEDFANSQPEIGDHLVLRKNVIVRVA